MINTSRTLTAIVALLSLAAFCPAPANAEPTEQLISQLRGHANYEGDGMMETSRYHIGRVRGFSGNVLSIEFFEPVAMENGKEVNSINITATGTVARRVIGVAPRTSEGQTYNSVGYPAPGDDVAVVYEDNQWKIVQRYNPYWVSRLELREVPVVTRSKFVWDPQPFGLPPLQQRTVVIEPAPTAAPEPVRGMW